MTSVTDAEGRSTTYEYDDVGRLLSASSPDTGTVTYVYDAAGRLVSKTDAKGITVEYAHDALNRLTRIDFPDDPDIVFSYDEGPDGMWRRTGMTDGSGSTAFGYDPRGRLIRKTSVINGHAYDLTRAFTPGGRVASMVYPTGRSVDYDRSGCACRVKGVSTTYNGITTVLAENLSYRPFGIADGMETGSGGVVENVFDESGRLVAANPGADKERSYTYDANGNLTSISAPAAPWQDRTYACDALNRLIEAAGDPFGSIAYTYDGAGNRLIRSVDGQAETYAYIPGTDRLREVTGPSGTITYGYDANGNITSAGNRTYIYNQAGRLIRVEEEGDVLGEYTYNGLGQRVIKDAGGVVTVFLYDFTGNVIGESGPDGAFRSEYLYRGEARLAKVDVATGTMSWYLNDRLGTPQMMTDGTNTVIWEGEYRPFGEAEVNPHSGVENNLRFPGQYYDQESGLHYNYHRYYDPGTGRYLTPDPIGLAGGISLYPYVDNNPVNGVDPLGLLSKGDIINWGSSVGAFIAQKGILISAKIVSRISLVGSVLGELIDPPSLNAEEDLELECSRTMQEIEGLNYRIEVMQKRLEPILDKLLIPYGWDNDSCH